MSFEPSLFADEPQKTYTLSWHDSYRLTKGHSITKSMLETALEEQRTITERILRLRVELACFEHCKEELA